MKKNIIKLLLILSSLFIIFGCDKEDKKSVITPTINQPTIISEGIDKLTNHFETLLKNFTKQDRKWVWKEHSFDTSFIETNYANYSVDENKFIFVCETVEEISNKKECRKMIFTFEEDGQVTIMLYKYNFETEKFELEEESEARTFNNIDLFIKEHNVNKIVPESVQNNLAKIETALLENLKDNQKENEKWIIEEEVGKQSKLSYEIIEDEFIVTVESSNKMDRYLVSVIDTGCINLILLEYNSEDEYWIKKQNEIIVYNTAEDLIAHMNDMGL